MSYNHTSVPVMYDVETIDNYKNLPPRHEGPALVPRQIDSDQATEERISLSFQHIAEAMAKMVATVILTVLLSCFELLFLLFLWPACLIAKCCDMVNDSHEPIGDPESQHKVKKCTTKAQNELARQNLIYSNAWSNFKSFFST